MVMIPMVQRNKSPAKLGFKGNAMVENPSADIQNVPQHPEALLKRQRYHRLRLLTSIFAPRRSSEMAETHTRWASTSYKWSYNTYKWPKINGFHWGEKILRF